ncbi:MAG: NB-ARC domain-containing protein, partial [Chloroflexota bacterium]
KSTGVEGWLLTDEATICMNPDISVSVDAVELEHIMKSVANVDETRLRHAIDLYVDEFMCGFILDDARAFNDWVQHRRQVFHRYHLDALEALARLAHDEGRMAEAAEYANRILEIDPLIEPIHRLLMRIYVQMKQRDRAISQYHQLVKFMRDELGLMPQAATRKLYEDLLHAEVRPEDTEPLMYVRENVTVSLLPALPQHIMGRSAEQQHLCDRILGERGSTLAVTGMPGVGKTTLVSWLVHEPDVQAAFPDGIFWVTCGEQPDIRKQLEIWCGTLNIMPESTPETTIMKIRATIASRKMLIVVDDVWAEADLQPFMVNGASSNLLVTTRYPGVARHAVRQRGSTLNLQPLNADASQDLVATYCAEAFEDYPEEMAALLEQVDGLPLALTLTGDLIAAEYDIGMVDVFLEESRDVGWLLGHVPGLDGLASPLDRKRTITQRLTAALEYGPSSEMTIHLKELAPLVTGGRAIAFDDLVNLWDRATARQCVRTLTDGGVLYPRGGGQFTLHRLWLSLTPVT